MPILNIDHRAVEVKTKYTATAVYIWPVRDAGASTDTIPEMNTIREKWAAGRPAIITRASFDRRLVQRGNR